MLGRNMNIAGISGSSVRGAALASVLFLMVILFAFSLSYFALMRMSCQYAVHAERQTRALAAARSGIEWYYATAKLVDSGVVPYALPAVGVSTVPTSLGNDSWFEVVRLPGPSNGCVVTGSVKNSNGVVLVTRRLALPSTDSSVNPVMEALYDPDSL